MGRKRIGPNGLPDPACAPWRHGLAVEINVLNQVDGMRGLEPMPRMSQSNVCSGLLILSLALSLAGCYLLNKSTSGSVSTLPSARASSEPTMDPKTVKSIMDAGNAKAKTGDWSGAIAEFQKVATANPKYAPAHVQIGWSYAEMKDWDNARTHLLMATSAAPDNASAHANLAWVYAEKQRWNDAMDEAKRAIDLDPKNAYAHATLAWAYQETKQDQLAIAEYEKSLELDPKLENSHFAVGMTYCNQGIKMQAQEHLAKLTELHSAQAPDLQARINKGCYPKK
jgi:tetratricopeptide (TPR) repeat protein